MSVVALKSQSAGARDSGATSTTTPATTRAAPHYWIIPSVPRPQAPHGFTGRSLLTKRWREVTSTTAISTALLLPYLINLNQLLERNIADLKCNTDTETGIGADAWEAAKLSITTAADNWAKIALHTLLAAKLADIGGPLCDSIVLNYDIGQRLPAEYVGRVLGAVRIPPSWATMLGPKATASDVSLFESRVSPTAAMQDAVKRNGLHLLASATVGILSRVAVYASPQVRSWMGRRTKVVTRPDPDDPTIMIGTREWEDQPRPTPQQLLGEIQEIVDSHVRRLIVSAVGAGVGSILGGGKGGPEEYWCETVGGTVLMQLSILATNVLRRELLARKGTAPAGTAPATA
jgi:hypothetical protein